MFPRAGQAYISRSDAISKDDIGVENASPDVISKALEAAGRTVSDIKEEYTSSDMMYYGLSGARDSRSLRDRLGRRLGIGYGNAAAFLKRLNGYGIERDELENILTEIENEK